MFTVTIVSFFIFAIFHLSLTNTFGEPSNILKWKDYLPEWPVELEPASEDFITAVTEAQDASGVTIVLSASFGYVENVMNSMCSMKRVGIQRALMVALDSEMFDWAKKTDFFVPVLLPSAGDDDSKRLIKYGSSGFGKVTMQKFMSVERVLAASSVALFVDGDIFWCKNPLPEILAAAAAAPEQDLIFQTSFEYVRKGIPLGDYINTGLILARPTVKARQFFLKSMKDWKQKPINNQRIVNNRICKAELGGRVVYRRIGLLGTERVPLYCTRDGLRVGFLSSRAFPNGPTRSKNALSRPSRASVRKACDEGKVTLLHNNYIEGKQKELRFKAQGLWFVDSITSACLTTPLPRPMAELGACGKPCDSWRKDRTK